MPGYRLMAPALPLVAVLVGLGVQGLVRGSRGRPRLATALLVVALGAPMLDAWAQLPELRRAGRLREAVGRPLGVWLGRHFEQVALVDAGFLPWVGGFRVLDLAGITDPRVARAPGGHLDKRFDPGLLAAARPDAIVLHSRVPPGVDAAGRIEALAGFPVEQRVAAQPWVRSQYEVVRVVRYAADYHYLVLALRSRDAQARERPLLRADRPAERAASRTF